MNNDILFLVKFGRKDHIEEIVKGSLRFAPSEEYIKIEQQQHNKGQGDLLEGKVVIHVMAANIYDPNTNQFVGKIENCKLTMEFENVNNLPVFCMTYGTKEDCVEYIDYKNFTIKFKTETVESIKSDFVNATHALIIVEPHVFFNRLSDLYNVVTEPIKYFDYNINSLQMWAHISGVNSVKSSQEYSLKYDNRHRHLLCKDIAFQNQKEFRLILIDEKISNPKKYEYNSNGLSYYLIPIEDLFKGFKVKI